MRKNSIQNHLCGAEFLTQAVVHGASDATSFVILRGNEAVGKTNEFAIESNELLRSAVQFRKNRDLGAQQFRNDGHGNIIHGPGLVAPEPVEIG